MPHDDSTLDRVSRSLIAKLARLRALEREKRDTARSTPEFHELTDEVSEVAEDVWRTALDEEAVGQHDSPIPEERAEQEPGDWTHKRDD